MEAALTLICNIMTTVPANLLVDHGGHTSSGIGPAQDTTFSHGKCYLTPINADAAPGFSFLPKALADERESASFYS